MNKNDELVYVMERLLEALGKDTFIDELFHAMTLDESMEHLEYIDRMFDVGAFDDLQRMQ